MYFLIAFIICLFVIIIIFAFPHFSPVPYFPSNGKDIPLILKALYIRDNQTIIDLGAGDGIVIFKAAERALQNKLNTKLIAVEINPVLLLILHIRRLFHPNRKNIKIIKKDMFILDYSELISTNPPLRRDQFQPILTIYMYISPWFIEKTVTNITKQIKNFDIVSYFYPVYFLPKHKEILIKGIHRIYKYNGKLSTGSPPPRG